MTAQEFVARLEAAAPSEKALQRQGLSRAEARDFARSFVPARRKRPTVAEAELGVIGRLLAEYVCSHVEIGMVRFPDEPFRNGDLWVIARVEADSMVLEPNSGEIAVHEFGTKQHVLWCCARDGESLLDALATASEYLGRKLVDDSLQDDDAQIALRACTSAAGGKRYGPFYRMLLGIG